MKLDLDALAAKKLLATAAIGLIGLAGLSACTDEADASTGSDEDTAATDDGGDGAEEAAAEETCEVAPAEEGAGTDFEAPLDLCTAGVVAAWEIAVTGVELDATETVLDANPFNEEPADGSQYLMFTLTGTNTGEEAADPFMDIWAAVDIGEYRYEESCGLLPEDLVHVGQVAPGESFTANHCVFVDTEGVDTATLALYDLLTVDEAETYYKLG